MAMILLDSVRKTFHAGKPNEFTAVDGVSVAIDPHRITVLKGPSGSGKTTLLSILGCMARPTAGRIRLGDREITSLPERFLTEVRRQTFGFIFQQFNLVKGISAVENVMIPALPTGKSHAAIRRRAMDLLAMFGVEKRADSKVEWLSGGEAQRVATARALINDPKAVIADEPTAHLDSRLSREFMETMADLRRRRKTVIIASHDPIVYESPDVAAVISMRDGRIVGREGEEAI
jgi:putative ABC transport system ATP-binding protein